MGNSNFSLIRVSYSIQGTFGVLLQDGVPFCLSLERKWEENKRGISCIPIGVYRCERTLSPRFGNTFEVKDVPDRSHILFHKGNLLEDTHGCIILGEEYGILSGYNAVLSSGRGFSEFLIRTTSIDEFYLEIGNTVSNSFKAWIKQ